MKLAFVTISTLFACLLISCTEQNVSSGDMIEDVQPPLTQEQQGMKIYLDPVTGKPSIPPTGAAVAGTTSPAVSSSLNTSTQGLVEQPAPGGGMMLDLKGRFQSSTKATVGKDGSIVIEHLPTTQSSALSKEK